MRIVSLDEYKAYAGVTVTTYDNQLTGLLDAVTAQIEAETRRTWGEIKTYTDYFDIMDEFRQDVLLKHFPVVSITSVTDNFEQSDGSGTAVTSDTYKINYDTGLLSLNEDQYFTMGPCKVKVVYTAGAVAIPEDLKLACKMQVKWLFDNRDSQGVQAEKMGDYSVNYAQVGALLPTVMEIVKRHRKIW